MKRNSLKTQRINAKLEQIIEDFGQAMRVAHRPYIIKPHIDSVHFTPRMTIVWRQYMYFCLEHPNE